MGDGGGEEDLWHVCSGGCSVTYVPSGGWERRICVMYAVGDTHSHMFPVGDGGGEEELWHVRSGGRSVTHVPSGGWGRRGGSQPCTQRGTFSDTCPQWGMGEEMRISAMYTSEGCSVTHVLSGGWQRKAGSQPCMQWGTLSDTCPQWGMGEERRISVMYTQ